MRKDLEIADFVLDLTGKEIFHLNTCNGTTLSCGFCEDIWCKLRKQCKDRYTNLQYARK